MILDDMNYESLLTKSRPYFMGIINVTPDSFSDGGTFINPEDALAHAEKLLAEGADILDIGAESTRPGAKAIDITTQWERLSPVLKWIRQQNDITISIDTRSAEIAKRALWEGANWINDVSGGRYDPRILQVCAEHHCPLILMHSRGIPANMMEHCAYEDLLKEILEELTLQVAAAKEQGVTKIMIDPGFGFAKTPEQNQYLLSHLAKININDYPLMIGVSRKRFLREQAGDDPEKLLSLGIQACQKAYQQGVRLFRVHEIAAYRKAFHEEL